MGGRDIVQMECNLLSWKKLKKVLSLVGFEPMQWRLPFPVASAFPLDHGDASVFPVFKTWSDDFSPVCVGLHFAIKAFCILLLTSRDAISAWNRSWDVEMVKINATFLVISRF